MIKRFALSLLVALFCSHFSFAADVAKPVLSEVEGQPGKSDNLSFNQLLKQFSAEYTAGLQMPEPPMPADSEGAGVQDDRYWITVQAADRYVRTRLLEAGVDIVEIRKNDLSGIAPKDSLALLAQKGYTIEKKVPLWQYIQSLKDFPAADAAYHNYQETTDLLKSLVSKNSDIASLFSLGKSVEKREIWCLRINSAAKGTASSGKPGAVYIGNHHAREHLSNEVPLLLAVYLLDHRNDADIGKYIAGLDIYIIPMLNPDGVEYDIRTGRYQWQRKNMRVNSNKSIGVDLNRNYDSWFGGQGASHYPSADTYCGPSAFSEPETLAVKKFVEARKNLTTMNSYHSYGGLIMYPWGGKDAPIDNEKDRQVFIKMASEMAKLTNYTPEQSNEMYIATGDTCDWAYDAAGIFAFTTELEGRGFYPGAAIIEKAVTRNVKAAVYMLSVTDNPYKILK
ncbi:MAG: zinc carboxypeptidase [Elusimicrobia bacterium]|nr:zinc carboxypeptidase [Elusimicrobiota bacterium]